MRRRSTLTEPIPLGPFRLVRPVGRGGMAAVWEGEHVRQGVRVAIKLMTGDRAPSHQVALRNEVRAMAGLDHPNIVMVLDQGEVQAEAEATSGGQLVAGAPWLAMELADSTIQRS